MAQKIHPTLFRLGWTKQSQNLWYSFQNSHYGTLFLQNLLWLQSLEGAFRQIGFLISDLFIQRTSQGIIFHIQLFPISQESLPTPSSIRLLSTSLSSSFREPIQKIKIWQIYNLCEEFQKILETWLQQSVQFHIEWVPTFTGNGTLMAKQIQSLLEHKVNLRKVLDTVVISRKLNKEFPFILPSHSYGSLLSWIWITLNSLRVHNKYSQLDYYTSTLNSNHTQNSWGFPTLSSLYILRSFLRRYQLSYGIWKKFNKGEPYLLFFTNFPLIFLFKKRRYNRGVIFGSLLKDLESKKTFRYFSQSYWPKIYRSNYLTQYWIGFLKIYLKSQLWKKESFQISLGKPLLTGDKAFQEGTKRYPLWGRLSPSLLHLSDFLLSSQFQIRQGRFCSYRLSGRLKGVDMAQTIKGRFGSFQDPYALETAKLKIQTPWGIYGLTISLT